ncbi:MAG: protein-methionine-sulfoxide reductase catalytic subunit MsrP [Candidatus Latescibacteria bacterium]|nr:protein-methionine-sulfoxide reductase catalytic subunit MsrP [Candidatus Latescibacterota bacterium]
MPLIRIRRGWEIPEREATPEAVYLNRRNFIKTLGLGSIGAFGLLSACRNGSADGTQAAAGQPSATRSVPKSATSNLYPARRNPNFKLDRPITPEQVAGRYNNFYEFSDQKDVWRYVDQFHTRPWQVEVKGLVEKPQVFDIDNLVRKMPLEERLYRHRCVEAWAMAVPWTGFPMKALLDHVQPKSSATHVRMLTFLRPSEAPGQREQDWYPWPYFEGLTMAEAMNELTFLVTGIYGHELTIPHGAPIRLATPWKYGYKSIKSIVLIEVTNKQPPTFWNKIAPDEYDFWSNVNPYKPHPRWSQARERMIDTGEYRDTLLYNGYAPYVAHLYQT